jgi:hypothetical protein
LRGDDGEWLGGFSKYLGNCSAFVAELWVLRKAFVARCLGSEEGILVFSGGEGGNLELQKVTLKFL